MQNTISYPSKATISTRPRISVPTKGICSVLEGETSPAAAALAAFNILNNNSNIAAGVVNQNLLGPYADNGSCGYGCSYEQEWNWHADYTPTNSNLIQAVMFVNCGGVYNTAYQPTLRWLGTDLPNFSNALITAINSSDFDGAYTVLQNNINEANQALESLVSFVNTNQNVGYLQTFSQNAQNWIINDARALQNDLIGKIHCGDGDVQNSINGMLGNVAAKFVNMQTSFNTVSSNLQSALQAVDLVSGVFISLQSRNRVVKDFISRASSFPSGSPTRQMYQNMAINEWNVFVSQANSQLR